MQRGLKKHSYDTQWALFVLHRKQPFSHLSKHQRMRSDQILAFNPKIIWTSSVISVQLCCCMSASPLGCLKYSPGLLMLHLYLYWMKLSLSLSHVNIWTLGLGSRQRCKLSQLEEYIGKGSNIQILHRQDFLCMRECLHKDNFNIWLFFLTRVRVRVRISSNISFFVKCWIKDHLESFHLKWNLFIFLL